MVDQSFGTSDILLRDEITSTLKILFERTKQKRARTIPKKRRANVHVCLHGLPRRALSLKAFHFQMVKGYFLDWKCKHITEW